VVRRGANEDLRIATPAHALVALRAVGRNLQEVGALTPNRVAIELIHERNRTLERAGVRTLRIKGDPRDRLRRGRLHHAGELDVTITMERELRSPDLLGAPRKGVIIGALRTA